MQFKINLSSDSTRYGTLVEQTASSRLRWEWGGDEFQLWNFTKLECGKAYTIIMAKGDGEIDIPNFYFSVADGGDQGRLVQECGAIIPPSTQQLEFRCHIIDGQDVLQVKNNLRPQHSNFITRDTTDWSTLYYFNPPHSSMTEDAYDLADPFWARCSSFSQLFKRCKLYNKLLFTICEYHYGK